MRVPRTRLLALLAALCLLALFATPTLAQGSTYVVQPGDTLTGVAQRFGVSPGALAQANGIAPNGWLYAGQRLVIPGASSAAPASSSAAGGMYVVQPGDTLSAIAARHGTTVGAIVQANGLQSANVIYVGQRLTIPAGGGTAASSSNSVANPNAASGEKWIDVNLTTQRLTAYEGQTPVYWAVVSTGLARYPTVTGTYYTYVKYRYDDMTGGTGADYYYLPDVPYVMYFYRGYGIHGTYWHNNFGTPMSHGCVNLTIADAEWVYNWAPLGTKVVTHY